MKPRVYASPAAFRVALEDRVKAAARSLGHADPTRYRQLLLADRLLARLTKEFGTALVAKGGIALEMRLPSARATNDLDVQLAGRTRDLEDRLREAARTDLGDGMTFAISDEDRDRGTIDGDGIYEGERFRVTASIGGRQYGDRFGLDIVQSAALEAEVTPTPGLDVLGFAGVERGSYRLLPREITSRRSFTPTRSLVLVRMGA